MCFQTFLRTGIKLKTSVGATCMKESHCADDILGYGMDGVKLVSRVVINISNLGLLSHIIVLFNIIIISAYFATSVMYIVYLWHYINLLLLGCTFKVE